MYTHNNDRYLLFINPSKDDKLGEDEVVEDELTEVMEQAMSEAVTGTSQRLRSGAIRFNPDDAYKGFHRTDCGEKSDNRDYMLKNGMITNSLAPFYLKYYRNSIPQTEFDKLNELKRFYDDTHEDRKKKWDGIGFLEGVDDEEKYEIADMLEIGSLCLSENPLFDSGKRIYLSEGGFGSETTTIFFPILRRLYRAYDVSKMNLDVRYVIHLLGEWADNGIEPKNQDGLPDVELALVEEFEKDCANKLELELKENE